MNLNAFSAVVTKEEGLKKSLSIAQVKEVLRIVLKILAAQDPGEVEKVLKRYR